jgi:hypothetical protein
MRDEGGSLAQRLVHLWFFFFCVLLDLRSALAKWVAFFRGDLITFDLSESPLPSAAFAISCENLLPVFPLRLGGFA